MNNINIYDEFLKYVSQIDNKVPAIIKNGLSPINYECYQYFITQQKHIAKFLSNYYNNTEAKFFAKYALAPPPLVHNICEEVNPFIIMNKFEISYEAARYACDYYHNWIEFGEPDYTKYERKMLELFNVA